MRKYLIPLFACAILSACGGEKHSDLRAFVKDSDNMQRGRIPPLPEVKPYSPVEYAAFDLTDPFKPRKIEPPKNAAAGGGIQPDVNRRREPLEAYPLEALKMVGVIKQKGFFANEFNVTENGTRLPDLAGNKRLGLRYKEVPVDIIYFEQQHKKGQSLIVAFGIVLDLLKHKLRHLVPRL